VVHDVVGREPHAEQRRRRVEVSGHAVARVDVFADAFQSSSLVEERGADAFTDDVPVGTNGNLTPKKKSSHLK